jgi:sigma-B regulation protein RsbU (phosphoserine phosphatase)
MLAALNRNLNGTPMQVLGNVRVSVDGFVKSAEQFDDLTMLCLEYKGKDG